MKKLLQAIPLLIVILLSFLVYFPGYLTNDSYLQWQEANSGSFTSDHPALMSALWSLFLPLTPKLMPQIPMLVIHLVAIGLGLWWIFTSSFPNQKGKAIWGAALFLLLPPVVALMGNIWKDVGMLSFWVLGVGLIFKAQFQHKFKLLWWALVPLFYGMSVRHNAPAAILPLLIWMNWVHFKAAPRKQIIKRSIVMMFALFAVSMLASKALTWGSDRHFISKYTLYDLAGISINEGKVIMPSHNQHFNLDELKLIYSPKTNEPLFGSWGFKSLNGPSNDKEIKETNLLWINSIIDYPLSYLKHRSQVFAATLGITKFVQFPYHMRVSPYQIKSESLPDFPFAIRAPAVSFISAISQSIFFRGYVYLLLNIFIIFFFWKKKSFAFREPYIALSSSSVLYVAVLFPLTGASDFRYNIWSMATACLVLIHYFIAKKAADPRIEIA